MLVRAPHRLARVAPLGALFLITAVATLAQAAPFTGSWRAVAEVRDGVRTAVPKAVKMVLTFGSNGQFRQVVQMGARAARPETGTWALSGGKLVVKSGPSSGRRSTRRFGYRVSRGRLLLSTQVGKQKVVMHLRRGR